MATPLSEAGYRAFGHGYIEGSRKPVPKGLAEAGYIAKPDNSSRMVTFALSILARDRHSLTPVDTVSFSATAETPPVGEAMARQFERNLPYQRPAVVEYLYAPTTIDEARAFKTLADAYGWEPASLVVVALEPHMRRVKRAYRRAFGRKAARNIKFLSAEEILQQDSLPKRYGRYMEMVQTSPNYEALRRREVIYNIFDAWPLGGTIMRVANAAQGDNKFLANTLYRFSGGK